MRQAELYVFRRHLNANEYGRLGERKMEKLKKTAGNLKRLNGGEPGPWTYHPERFDLIGSKKEAMRPSSAGAHIRGIVIAGRYTSSAGDLIAPGPATYEIRGEGFNASGLYSHTRGSARIVPQCGPSKAEANSDHEVGFNAAISSFSAYGVEHRGTPFSSGGSGFTVQGRLAVEKDWSRTIGQVYNPDTANWEQGNPGPGEYTPRKPGVVAPTIAGRGSFEKDHLRESGMVRVRQEGKVDLLPRRKSETEGSKAEQGARRQSEVAEKLVLSGTGTQKPHKKPEDHFEWVPLVPGPNAYTPRVRNDGTALDASAAPSVSIVPRVVPLQGMEVPGPGAYDIPSIFSDRDHPSFREGPAWCLGERPPPAVANQGPGPGEYSANVYGAIGTDKVAIGAAMRAETGRSATEVVRAVRDKTYLYGEKLSEGHANIVRDEGGGKPALLNYSAMNKAVTAVKEGLQDRFSTVYDAFAYFDINGDWHVTPNEFATMLKKLQMGISDRDLTMLMHRLDAITDGTIDPKEFVSVLRWHPKPKSLSEMHQSMNQASQRRPMTLKAVQTRVFELTRMGKSMSFPDEVHQRQGKLLTPDHVPATQRPSEVADFF
ncbi:hypothetical protein T484DRAFT_2677395 [Baffinella frigidus]|nr:hypothetical protein T484DRAFT_2677395 [Cryptophyta sp. CCMP2293]